MKHVKFNLMIWLIPLYLYAFMPLMHPQTAPEGNYVLIKPTDTPEQIIEKAANVTPSRRQYEWQKMEFTAFVHFGINTFDNLEWGKKNMDISKFNPKEINVNQWVKVFKDAGMKQIILTAKHHDGFCLWPTKYNNYNISNTPFQNGKGDIVKDLSEACHKAGLKFGVYLSPWDMHAKTYGSSAYNTYFENLLTELLTNYGKISEVWFDGANGEGPNGKKQIYDWHSYYKLIRKLQPDAVIAIMGPDVRWVGTESGYGRKTEWSVLPGSSENLEKIAANSQQKALDNAFIPKDLMGEDLGSRDKIEKAFSLIWYPAEVDVSIRPGWFYHKADDSAVKSPYKLVDIYYNSVGLNDVLLLNVPPDKRGLITKYDIKSLKGMRYILNETFKNNLAENGKATSSTEKKGNEAKYILDNDLNTFWTTKDTLSTASIEVDLNKEKTFDRAMLQENILAGQRIEKFHLEYWNGSQWEKFAEATTIGYKRLLRFPAVTTNKVKIVIDQCRTNPTLSSFGLYMAPPEIKFDPDGNSFLDTTSFKILGDNKSASIYYTLDGTIPDKNSTEYSDSITINKTTTVTAIAVSKNGKESIPFTASFHKAKFAISLKTNYSPKYPGSGRYNLVDGVHGSTNFNDGNWQGYDGNDLDAVIDLGKVKDIKKISASFLSDENSFIFLPSSVEYSVSNDGHNFKLVSDLNNKISEKGTKAFIYSFDFNTDNISARFIQIKAKNIGVCPEWHKGAGEKAWLFCDEIAVE
ncbi:MAG: alpha-L-fucosidase [Ignavibacteriaceae bacterium]